MYINSHVLVRAVYGLASVGTNILILYWWKLQNKLVTLSLLLLMHS